MARQKIQYGIVVDGKLYPSFGGLAAVEREAAKLALTSPTGAAQVLRYYKGAMFIAGGKEKYFVGKRSVMRLRVK